MSRGNSTKREKMSADGENAPATILKIWDSGATAGGDSTIGLLLEVRPSKRPAYLAQTKLVYPRPPRQPLQPGQVVDVKIDPSDPSKVSIQVNRPRGHRSL